MRTVRAIFFAALLFVLAPSVNAAFPPEPSLRSGPTFASFVYGSIVPVIDGLLIPLMYAVAFMFFLVGMVRLFFSDSEERRSSGKQFALWSVIGFAVLFSVWGLVKVLLSVLQSTM